MKFLKMKRWNRQALLERNGVVKGYRITFIEPEFPDLVQAINGCTMYASALFQVSRLLNQGITSISIEEMGK